MHICIINVQFFCLLLNETTWKSQFTRYCKRQMSKNVRFEKIRFPTPNAHLFMTNCGNSVHFSGLPNGALQTAIGSWCYRLLSSFQFVLSRCQPGHLGASGLGLTCWAPLKIGISTLSAPCGLQGGVPNRDPIFRGMSNCVRIFEFSAGVVVSQCLSLFWQKIGEHLVKLYIVFWYNLKGKQING